MSDPVSSPFDEITPWTLAEVARRRLVASPDAPFVTEVGGLSRSYGAFIGESAALAAFLRGRGIVPGSSLATFCPAGIPALHAWLAAGLAGLVDVTINPSFTGEPLAHILRVTRPAAMVVEAGRLAGIFALAGTLTDLREVVVVGGVPEGVQPPPGVTVHDHAAIVARLADRLPDVSPRERDPASVMFTSGTTGPSKGAILPHRQVCLLAHQAIVNTAMTGEDVYYCAHPLNHIAGKFMGVLAAFATGARLVLDRKFDAGLWLDRIREYGVTLSIAHGPMIEMIHARPPGPHDADHAMRRLMCCPLPKHVGAAFEERFALRGIEMWGMTEVTCPLWTPRDGERPIGSCGRVMEDWFEVAIVDPETDAELPHGETGEIVVRPREPWTTMSGYMGMPEETVKAWRNLWFHTGDAGVRDERGNFFMVDRIGDRIRRRAENISSWDIETAALAHAAVGEAAAVGVPSGMEGDDDIKLFVVLKSGMTLDYADFLSILAARLPHFMVPRYVEIVPALPRTLTNKIRKRELRGRGISPQMWDRHAAGMRLREVMQK